MSKLREIVKFADRVKNPLKGIDASKLRLRLIDAKGEVVGRLATHLATILQGKDKPTYTPHKDEGDVVVLINAKEVVFTGRKWDQKLYRWHTGYPGGLKERTAKDQFERKPEQIIYNAVVGMLPKNKLRRARASKLRIFPDEQHSFEGHPHLVTWEVPERKLREKEPIFDLPEGFEPVNPEGYYKRYGKRLAKLPADRERPNFDDFVPLK